jgi:hypothetical protein
MPRIALIHALSHSVDPINAVMASEWPEANCMNLLDDSLSADLARFGQGLDERMHKRFQDLAAYAVGTGADGILFTCSAFGPCIEAIAQRYPQIHPVRSDSLRPSDRHWRPCHPNFLILSMCAMPSQLVRSMRSTAATQSAMINLSPSRQGFWLQLAATQSPSRSSAWPARVMRVKRQAAN